jgi:hypothetical protein
MVIKDENGKPTLEKPLTGEIKQLEKPIPLLPLSFRVDLNRTGKFTIELTATDNLGKKSSTIKLPITVLDLKELYK